MFDEIPSEPKPNPPRKQRSAWLGLLRSAALGYLAVIALVLLLENYLIFHPAGADHWAKPPRDVPIEDVEFACADGTPLHGWWAAPRGWKPADGALLFCHGNGGNVSHRGWALAPLVKATGCAVLLFDYPGYGKSGGNLGEAGCYAAGEAAYDWLIDHRKVPAERVVLYGGSLGSGVAVNLATHRPHRALVLISAFTSMPDMAQKVFPWLPARWLVRTQFNNLQRLPGCPRPVFVAHGRTDALIPFSQGETLFAAAADPKQFFAMENYRHMDCPDEKCYGALERFLKETAEPIGLARKPADR